MRALALFLAAMLMTASAYAEVPRLVRVTGLEQSDALNVRAEPSARTADIGDLAEGTVVEVLETAEKGKWGRILWAEGDGWIALRHTEAVDLPQIGETAVPDGLLCLGSEPFWSLAISAQALVFETPAEADEATLEYALPAAGRPGLPAALTGGGITAIVRAGACTDGMSDRTYGWSADVVRGAMLYSGCCTAAMP